MTKTSPRLSASSPTTTRAALRVKFSMDLKDVEKLLVEFGAMGTWFEETLRSQMGRLAEHPCGMHAVIEDPRSGKLLAAGTSIFIRQSFFECLCQSPVPWVMNRADEWILAGRDPFITADERRRLNSTDGLINLVTTFGIFETGDWSRGHLYNILLHNFNSEHRGYRSVLSVAEPAASVNIVEHLLKQGYIVVNDYREWHLEQGSTPPPVLTAIRRREAVNGHDHYLARAFDYRVPVAEFTPGMQDLLIQATRGGTDEELAEYLCIGLETVKKRWASIYDKLDEHLPGVLPAKVEGRRGRERRRLAIQFAEDNPWELRPYDKAMLTPLKDDEPVPRFF